MSFFFFFNDTATTEIYTLSLHDALPICGEARARVRLHHAAAEAAGVLGLDRCADRGPLMGAATTRVWLGALVADRKSTRLNSSHLVISYAVFCLKKKKKNHEDSDHVVVT